MAWIAPIIASQTQEDNDNYNEENSSLWVKKSLIISTTIGSMFLLGIFFFIGRSGVFSFFYLLLMITLFILIGSIISASKARSRGRRSQNYSQRQRRESYSLEQYASTITNTQKYCNQCGNIVDRKHIDRVSVFYCSHCGYEIKNSRV